MEIFENKALLQLAESIGIEILEGGYADLTTDWNMKDACSPFTRLYYVERGEGRLHFPEQELVLAPGYVYLIPQGMVYDYDCQNFLQKLFFHINVPLHNGFDLFHDEKSCCRLPVQPEKIRQMHELFFENSLEAALFLKGKIYGDVARFIGMAGLSAKAQERHSELVTRVFSLVTQSVTSNTGVRALSRELAVSESTLSKHFKAETGMTLGAYIDRVLLEKSRRLLIGTEQSIGEIAEQLQFCDQFYFARFFKQHQGESPSSYRRRLKQVM